MIVDAHPKEFIGVKLHQSVFLVELDKYIGIVCTVHKALDKDLVPLIIGLITIIQFHRHMIVFFRFYR